MTNKLTFFGQRSLTENELGLAFPPRNLLKKFRLDPSTVYLVIVVTKKQTNRQTNSGDYIIPRESFRGDNDHDSVNVYGVVLIFTTRVRLVRQINADTTPEQRGLQSSRIAGRAHKAAYYYRRSSMVCVSVCLYVSHVLTQQLDPLVSKKGVHIQLTN